MTVRTKVKLGIPPDSPIESNVVPLFSSPSLGVPMWSSSPVNNNSPPPVEGPYLCDGCDLEYNTYDEAAACENKHLQENDDMRRRDKIKMIFATLLRKQEDVPGNDRVKRFAKVITDIIKGGRTATILQSRVLLFEYLDDIRVEVVTSSDDDNNAIDFDDEKGIGSNLVDQIMKTAMEMKAIQPQQPSKWFGDIANATSTTTMPTFTVGVAGPSTTSSLAMTSSFMTSSFNPLCGRFKPNSTFVFDPNAPLLLSKAPVWNGAKHKEAIIDVLTSDTTGCPPMSSLALASNDTTKKAIRDASFPPMSVTPLSFNAFSKKEDEEAKPIVKKSINAGFPPMSSDTKSATTSAFPPMSVTAPSPFTVFSKKEEEAKPIVKNTINAGFPPMSSDTKSATTSAFPPMSVTAPSPFTVFSKKEEEAKPIVKNTINAGFPPMSSDTKSATTSAFSALSKEKEAKPTVKSSSTAVPQSVINSSPAPVTSVLTKGKYACLVCDKVFPIWGQCLNHRDKYHPGAKFVKWQAEARLPRVGTPNSYCDVCNLYCANEKSLHQHQTGKKHMKQATIAMQNTFQPPNGKGDSAHYIASSDDSMTVSSAGIIDNCDDVVEKLMSYIGGEFKATVVHQDSSGLLNILPMEWSDALVAIGMDNVSDISLDLGRRPYCWHNHQRKYLCDRTDHVVNEYDIDKITMWLQDFGDDNRAGIDGQLHRISAIRNNMNKIIGLTIRVGRYIEGNSDMIRDLLEEGNKSILILGEPGSGKTTIVRDVAKILSMKDNVFIIDTSNEIAGDGNIPHLCVGDSRRMMVQSLSSQADTMIQCVQNHTPTVMIIDEIGRKREVEAAQTSKNRGVRMVASAHGDLRSLLKNKDIRGLIGGLETVAVGDAVAKEIQRKSQSSTIQKQLTTRAAVPIFEVIIEVKRDRLNEWHVITDAAKAVDDILRGEKYEVQKRMRCANSGRIFVERIQC